MKIQYFLTVASTLSLISYSASAQDVQLHGFAETAYGARVEENAVLGNNENTLGETRLELQLSHYGETAEFFSAIDFLNDNAGGGASSLSVREAYIKFGLWGKADVKAGRQVVTWGTGDLLFINDIFPKDYISFFTGREDQYLKLPSDGLRVRFYTPVFDVDMVGIPFFEPDQLPTGQRLSYFNPLAGGVVGSDFTSTSLTPDKKPANSEVAARFYRYLGSYQVSGYVFRGYYKDPMGIDMTQGAMYYPELSVYGTSVRGPILSGVLSGEYGYYDSREDGDGDNPLIPNSQHRYLLGFERQWWTDFTLGLQYYGEFMQDHDSYINTLPPSTPGFDELRQVVTARLTQMLFYQTVNLSMFTFYSPTDEDWHLRPNVTYKYSDQLSLSAGGNFFGGNQVYTLFGQFENNNNLYTRIRYSF
ncbi:MAG: hypothetical protein JXB48_06320 [Candidatus Latescibacteria bacterium]|nr:hypothetical protein [Candidatus Latescibacterota bacterium]